MSGGAPGSAPDPQFRVLSRRLIHRARKFALVEERVRFSDGREVAREVIRHPGAAVIVPVLPDGRVVLVRVWRHAAAGNLLEVPAGTLDPGEEPRVCAFRELEEETGYVAETMTPMGSWYPSPGFLDETMHLFRAGGLTESAAHPDDDELVEPAIFDPAELVAAVRDGSIRDGKTLLALFLCGFLAADPAGGPA